MGFCGGTCCSSPAASNLNGSVALPFVIPTEAKRSGGICSSADPSWKCFFTFPRHNPSGQKHHLEAVCGAAGLSVISALPTHAVLPLSHWGSLNSHPTRFCSVSPCTVPLAIRVLRPAMISKFGPGAIEIVYHWFVSPPAAV